MGTRCQALRTADIPDAPAFIGRSRAIKTLVEELPAAAESDAKVLITGESGVGKEIAACQIHMLSRRRRAPLVTLNCAGVPDTLLESELFGHVRGSFTGAVHNKAGLLEAAASGTVFLDEVGEMSARMQAVLLRFLETGEIHRVGSVGREIRADVRVIAATNRDLLADTATGAFRKDLYYRLNVIHIAIPPLRERREDIALLVEHYLRFFARQHGRPPCVLRPDALNALQAYDWPGNVREVRNVVERLAVGCETHVTAADLPPDVLQGPATPAERPQIFVVPAPIADERFDAMVRDGETFWSAVHAPFMSRDLTRGHLRAIVERGLRETAGNYRLLVRLFNIQPADYRRFLNFLRAHRCSVDFKAFRRPKTELRREGSGRSSATAPLRMSA